MEKTEKKLPSLRDKEYEKNPFVLQLKDKMFIQPRANTIIAKGEKIIDTNTGEIIKEHILIGRKKYVDKSQFAKIYATEIGVLYDLSKTAQNVFFYLSKVMDFDNRAILNHSVHCKKIGYKTNTPVIKGLRELIQAGIIASSDTAHVYWLNPLIVCKGERFAKYMEYVATDDPNLLDGETEVKKQGKKQIESLPPQVEKKVNNGQLSLFDDEGNPYNKADLYKD